MIDHREVSRVFTRNGFEINEKGSTSFKEQKVPMIDVAIPSTEIESVKTDFVCSVAKAIGIVYGCCYQVDGWQRNSSGRINGVRIYFYPKCLEDNIDQERKTHHEYV